MKLVLSIIISAKRGQKKIIKRNAKPYQRFSEHIGFLPLVIISPTDSNLIIEGSDLRRKFMDSIISLKDQKYLQSLLNYNKVLAQRNSLLKCAVKLRRMSKKRKNPELSESRIGFLLRREV